MAKLNRTNFTLKLKRGLAASVESFVTSNFASQGEPHYATDTEQVFVFNGSENKPIQTLDMAVTHNDEIVIHNDSIVYFF